MSSAGAADSARLGGVLREPAPNLANPKNPKNLSII
jgi:hypothetical protein